MATVMCVSDDGNKATFIGTFLESGDNVRLCDECMPNFCAAVFERMTGVDMTPALYLASEEGQANPDGPVGHPEEVAFPPDMKDRSGPTEEDPTSGDTGTDGEREPASSNSSSPPGPPPADTDQDAEPPILSDGEQFADNLDDIGGNSYVDPSEVAKGPPEKEPRRTTAEQ